MTREYPCNVTISNRTGDSIECASLRAVFGSYITRPAHSIPADGSNTFGYRSANDMAEGELIYRTSTNAQVKIRFKSVMGGNFCAVTPEDKAHVTYNSKGSPLDASIEIHN